MARYSDHQRARDRGPAPRGSRPRAELEGPKAHADLAENFEYHAAKNEQALLERRNTILRDRLDSAVIVDSGESEVVTVGSRVLVKDEAGEPSGLEISSLGGEGIVFEPVA